MNSRLLGLLDNYHNKSYDIICYLVYTQTSSFSLNYRFLPNIQIFVEIFYSFTIDVIISYYFIYSMLLLKEINSWNDLICSQKISS